MNKHGIQQTLIAILLVISIVSLYINFKKEPDMPLIPEELAMTFPGQDNMSVQQYSTKTFDIAGKIYNLSASQINQHLQLYAGYVKKRNEITQALTTVNRAGSANRTFSPYRSLKIAETYAVNGALLHELYFENLSPEITNVGPHMRKLIEKSFGSFEMFKADLLDSAGCARGWAVTMYGIDDQLLHNYVLEEHNQNVPVLTIPLLVCDVYEHAYMIDFGIKREPYLKVFWEHINWNIVEERISKWVSPLQNK